MNMFLECTIEFAINGYKVKILIVCINYPKYHVILTRSLAKENNIFYRQICNNRSQYLSCR